MKRAPRQPAGESRQASRGGISSLMFWRKRRARRIEGQSCQPGEGPVTEPQVHGRQGQKGSRRG